MTRSSQTKQEWALSISEKLVEESVGLPGVRGHQDSCPWSLLPLAGSTISEPLSRDGCQSAAVPFMSVYGEVPNVSLVPECGEHLMADQVDQRER